MTNKYGPPTEEVARLLRENGIEDPDEFKIKCVDDQKVVGENHKTGHEIMIIRGICRKWL